MLSVGNGAGSTMPRVCLQVPPCAQYSTVLFPLWHMQFARVFSGLSQRACTFSVMLVFSVLPARRLCGRAVPQAAGAIHTDFERGFICAEVMHYDELKELGSESAVKAAGKYRQEGGPTAYIDTVCCCHAALLSCCPAWRAPGSLAVKCISC